MNIAFDPREWSCAMPDDVAAQACAHPDWHALRARLNASVEAWAMLGRTGGAYSTAVFGSFSRRTSESLERITRHCDPVNQTGSVNRKRGGCIIHQVAGLSTFGERG
jgi:hypothetical protein